MKLLVAEEAHKKLRKEKSGQTMRDAKADFRKNAEQTERAGITPKGPFCIIQFYWFFNSQISILLKMIF